MIVDGYKGFNGNKTNRYGYTFEEGKTYKIDGDISFGNEGNGFHMCTSLSDVFRYFDDDIVVARVIGYGNTVCYNDEYNGYYEMYAVSNLYITKFLTREEIVDKMLKCSDIDTLKFISTYVLNEEEKKLFLQKYNQDIKMKKYILYYQYGYKNIFSNKNEDYQEGVYPYLDILVRINQKYFKNSNIRLNTTEDLITIDFMIREFYQYLVTENNLRNIIASLLNLCGRSWLLQPFYDGNTKTLKDFMTIIFHELGYIIDMNNPDIPIIPIFYYENEICEEKDIQNILNRLKKRK